MTANKAHYEDFHGKEIIGWKEIVSLPKWRIKNLQAKIDTGAKSSSLHVEDIKELSGNRVSFYVVLSRYEESERVKVVSEISRQTRVKSSTGHHDTRYFVKTRIRIGHIEKEIELNLTNRGAMIHRMLLGRTLLEGTFLVDVSQQRLIGKKKKRKK